jgi:two-component system cell cycle response regulator
MHDPSDRDSDSLDPEATCPTVPAMLAEGPASTDSRCDTPLLPTELPLSTSSRATLTLLTGMHAGRPTTVDSAGLIVGRAGEANLILEDAGVSRRHARVARASDGSFYVEDLGSANGTFVGSARVGIALLRQGDVLQLGPHVRIGFAMVDEAEESLRQNLYEFSVHDPLTHLYNRKYLADRLLSEVARARRTNGELSLLMADVDSLKHVNDRFGHVAGDRAVCIVGARIKRAIRIDDVLARYGGDEFVVIAPGTGAVEALHLAERVRRAIGELLLGARGEVVHLTLSIGVASLAEVTSADRHLPGLVALADTRLYRAKREGRNRVCSVSPSA